LSGSVRISTQYDSSGLKLSHDSFVFLPVGTRINWRSLASSSVLLAQLDEGSGEIPECPTFRLQRDGLSDVCAPGDSPDSSDSHDGGIYPLPVNDRIDYFLNGLLATERDGLKCANYAKLAVNQLLFLIQVYYPIEEYSRFYSAIMSPDVVFSDFVYANWRARPTVNELSTAIDMSTQQFSSRFQKVFGVSPGVWLRRRKAEEIYFDICKSRKSLRSIASAYNFSMANFIRFCRNNFGSSPGAIRKGLAAEKIESA
jgi:AraC-like DNA-binding protein